MFSVIRNALSKKLAQAEPSKARACLPGRHLACPENAVPEQSRTSDSFRRVNLEEIAADIVALYNQAPRLSQTAERMDSHAHEQADTVGQLSQKTEEITRRLDLVVEQLEASAQQALSSLKLIAEITQTTKILALNASIEAARAGVAGRPFEVVATEMRRLASQTEETSTHMSWILQNMQEKVPDVVAVVGKADPGDVSGAVNASSVAALTRVFHDISGRAHMQKDEAHEVHHMSGVAKLMSERLLLEVGKLRFGIHARCEAIIAGLIGHPDLCSANRKAIERLLEQAMRQHNYLDLLYVTDRLGVQITRNIGRNLDSQDGGKSALGRDWSQRPWFSSALGHQGPYTSDLYLSVATNEFCFTVSQVIRDGGGRVAGVLGADINFERLLQL